jgi:hypothetical protein
MVRASALKAAARKVEPFRTAARRVLDYETGLRLVHTLSRSDTSFIEDDV